MKGIDVNDRQEPPQSDDALPAIRSLIWEAAQRSKGDNLALLSLLRVIEELHRQVRQELFEPSLPNTRNDLYHLVRAIEESGGWPYIERMRLQDLLQNWLSDREAALSQEAGASESSSEAIGD